MKNKNQDAVIIRKYLLCELIDDELEDFEARLRGDDRFFEQVALAEDDLIDECAWEEMPEEERGKFERAFLNTGERRERVILAMALREKALSLESSEAIDPVGKPGSAVWRMSQSVAPMLRMAAFFLVALGLGFLIWRVFFFESNASKAMAALNQAYTRQRPVEARISGFDHKTFAPSRGLDYIDERSLNRARGIISAVGDTEADAELLQVSGRFYLTQKEFDAAIEEFDRALRETPQNASLHSDMGAAWLEKGKGEGSRQKTELGNRSMEYFSKSRAYLDKALELDGSLIEALFNRALCFQEMKLTDLAEKDWKQYIE